MSETLLILNGPNLNKLGTRQPEIYGTDTLQDIEAACVKKAQKYGVGVVFKQSNHEGDLVDFIQQACEKYAGLIINPAAYAHTSVAVLDALLNCSLPKIEVHLSNIHKREEFRRMSYASAAVDAVLCGFGAFGYELAVEAMCTRFLKK